MAPPMSVLWHTVVSFWGDGKLHIRSVFIWGYSLEHTLVTGSLLLVAPGHRQAALGDCRIVLRLLRVSAALLLCAVDVISWVVFVDQFVTIMATGSGWSDPGKPGRNLQVRVTLGSTELYDLDTKCVLDVMGLRARRPDAPVVKVMSGSDNHCDRVLIPDDNVGDQGFHDLLLFDKTGADATSVSINDLSSLRQQWPVLVVSGMARHQLQL